MALFRTARVLTIRHHGTFLVPSCCSTLLKTLPVSVHQQGARLFSKGVSIKVPVFHIPNRGFVTGSTWSVRRSSVADSSGDPNAAQPRRRSQLTTIRLWVAGLIVLVFVMYESSRVVVYSLDVQQPSAIPTYSLLRLALGDPSKRYFTFYPHMSISADRAPRAEDRKPLDMSIINVDEFARRMIQMGNVYWVDAAGASFLRSMPVKQQLADGQRLQAGDQIGAFKVVSRNDYAILVQGKAFGGADVFISYELPKVLVTESADVYAPAIGTVVASDSTLATALAWLGFRWHCITSKIHLKSTVRSMQYASGILESWKPYLRPPMEDLPKYLQALEEERKRQRHASLGTASSSSTSAQ